MKKQVKLTLVLAAVVILMLSLAVCANAASSGTCGDNLTWTLDDGGTLTVSGTGDMEDYSYASATPWYSVRTSIKKVVVEEGVTSIGRNAFSNLTKLTEAELCEGLITIGANGFRFSTALEEIVLPDTLTNLGNSCFYGCSSLKRVVIGKGLTSIGSSMFWGCSLTEITMPPNVTSADSGAFGSGKTVVKGYTYSYAEIFAEDFGFTFESIGEMPYEVVATGNITDTIMWQYDNYRELKITGEGEIPDYSSYSSVPWNTYRSQIGNIVVGEGITVLGNYVFAYSSSLKSVSLPSTLTKMNAFVFSNCSKLSEVVIPEGVNSMGAEMFQRCTKLEYVTIPASVKEITGEIFYYCDAVVRGYTYSMAESYCRINDITFESIGELPYEIFYEGSLTDTITWKMDNHWTLTIEGTGEMPDFASEEDIPWTNYQQNIQNIVIGENITTIGESSFYNCVYTEKITLPDSITKIGNNAFDGCSMLSDITLGNNITEIGNNAFYSCSALEALTIPEGISEIKSDTFNGCSALEKVSLPSTVSVIGKNAFKGCTALNTINIPDGVTSIGSDAFYNCKTLTKITLPAGVTEIRDNLFYNCSELGELEVKGQITSIGDNAFYKAGIKSFEIPAGVTRIGVSAFENCKELESVVISSGVEIIGKECFMGCSSLTSVEIPDSVTEIGESAFNSCTSLSSVVLPKGTETIKPNTFYGCSKLESITLYEGLETIGSYAFYSCTSLSGVTIPTTVTQIGSNAFYKSLKNTSLTVSANVKSIGERAFANSGITSLTLEEGVEVIGESAFSGCTGITEVIFPESVTTIGESAFYGCNGLTVVTIPENVTQIGGSAFYSCKGLKEVTIEGFGDIGESAFYNCSALEKVTIAGEIDTLGEYAFGYNKVLSQFDITGSVKVIDENCFYNCSALVELDLSKGVQSVRDYAFSYCSKLEKVTFGEVLTEISSSRYVFRNCSSDLTLYGYENTAAKTHADTYGYNFVSLGMTEGVVYAGGDISDTVSWSLNNIGVLTIYGNGPLEDLSYYTDQPWYKYTNKITKIVVEEGITYIGKYAFYYMRSVKEAEIKGVTEVAGIAFFDCTALESVRFGEGLKTIGESAFKSCTALTSVTLPEGLTTIGESAFYQCKALVSITIPEGVTTIGETAFGYCSALERINMSQSVTSIASDAFKNNTSVKIYGYTGSLVQAYAQQYSFTFVSCGEMEEGVELLTGSLGNMTYTLESHGVLTVRGAGTIDKEWTLWSNFIETVNIDMGINGISSAFMKNTPNVKTLAIPYTTIYISSSFYNNLPDDITIIGFEGSKAEEVANKRSYRFLNVGKMPDVEVLSGTSDTAAWSLTTTGKLTIKGEGILPNNFEDRIGSAYGSTVKEIVIEEGITGIEGYALYWNFDNAQILRTPSTVREVGTHSVFPRNEGLTVYCYEYSAVHDYLLGSSAAFEVVGVSPEWIKDEGTYGDNITWSYTNYRNLTISGEGAIPEGDIPWEDYNKTAEILTLSGDITLFADGSLPTIGKLETIYGYENSIAERMAQWGGVKFVATGTLEEAEVILSGQLTNTISYELDSFGKLTITGTGEMPDYTSYGDTIPWAGFDISPVEEIIISDGITRIGDYTFSNCYMADTVAFGADLASIGDYAFYYSGIREARIPDKVTQIGSHVFGGSYNLESVWLPEGITAIPDYAFNSCMNLTHIQLPKSLTTIGNNAFTASGLEYIYYGSTTTDWENRVTGKESIPEGVTVYYMKEIPEVVSFTVTSVRKTSDGVTIIVDATLKGGEGLYIAAYDENGSMIGIRSVHKSGTYSTTFDSSTKMVKVFVWEDTDSLAPIEQAYTRKVV